MKQVSFMDVPVQKGHSIGSKVYEVFGEFMLTFTSYEMSYKYVFHTAKEEIAQATEPGGHLLLEPIIVPSICSAIFVAMYGDFEGYLKLLCKSLGESKNSKIKISDIKGQGIVQAVDYLYLVINVNNIKQHQEWRKLKNWNIIRNILVHNNGQLRDEKDLQAVKDLNVGYNQKKNKVYITYDNCEDFHSTIVEFFKKCID